MADYRCPDCDKPVTKRGARCRSCGALQRWQTNPHFTQPVQVLGGVRYYRQEPEGYYRRSRHGGGTLMHRDVWEAAHGPLPADWHVHHRDGDPANNDLGNLVALDPVAHLSGEHGDHPSWSEHERARQSDLKLAWWRERKPQDHDCQQCSRRFASTATRVRFCSPKCNSDFWNAERARRRRSAASPSR